MDAKFTTTELRILQLLADGRPHKRKEIHACLEDELAEMKAIRFHIMNIRRKLPRSETVVCEVFGSTICYRHVRLLAGANDTYSG